MKKIVVVQDADTHERMYVNGNLHVPKGPDDGTVYAAEIEFVSGGFPFILEVKTTDFCMNTWPATLAEVEAMVAKGGEE